MSDSPPLGVPIAPPGVVVHLGGEPDDDDEVILEPERRPSGSRRRSRDEEEDRRNQRIRNNIGRDPAGPPDEARSADVPVPHHYNHPPLPITAPDYSYVMDITDMKSLLGIRTGKVVENRRLIDRVARIVTNAVNNNRVNAGYRYLLTFIDTTSRKAWQYPIRRKDKDSVYACFRRFMNDVHGKVARLLSDNDKSFKEIENHNNFFTYCLITASHNNHKQFGIIDRFTRTFRDLLYFYFTYYAHGPDYSWYVAQPIVLDQYNNTRHKGLFLRGRPKTNPAGDIKKFYYTPNEVWFSPRLRSRIRLRHYFDGYQNYLPGSLYHRIKNAARVRVRLLRNEMGHGGDAFSGVSYPKGAKKGNAWLVNNRWYTYRNLWPVEDHHVHDVHAGVRPDDSETMKIAKRARYYSKYKFPEAHERWLARHPEYEWRFTVGDKRPKSSGVTVNRAREIGNLRGDIEKSDGRDKVDMGLDYIDKVRAQEKEGGPRYNMRKRKGGYLRLPRIYKKLIRLQ